MTREQLIKSIYDNDELWSCPGHPCDLPEEEGNTGECCMKCAEKQLWEYEQRLLSPGERCENCKHFIPCKDLKNGEWVWFHICDLFAHEKDGWAIVTTANDLCECFEERKMIQDSGERRSFESGAVRDIQQGKGRCDLLPLNEVSEMLMCAKDLELVPSDCDTLLELIDDGMYIGAAVVFALHVYEDIYTAILEIAKHFEDGSTKYGERNWEKGIPCHSFLDSGIRHLLRFYKGDADERHDRAFMWNMLCLAWTIKHHPEMNDLVSKRGSNEDKTA